MITNEQAYDDMKHQRDNERAKSINLTAELAALRAERDALKQALQNILLVEFETDFETAMFKGEEAKEFFEARTKARAALDKGEK